MNYIELNGVKSTEISGLIIQELPPISKPLMRTTIEEIDGRDGDIVTKLGYSAIDKTIQIGLSFNYNVDDVIKYFNSEGVVTFSNEPNKYYNYQMLEQIDFEKLIRFKTASVVLHCQPFKYSTTEEDIEVDATETSGEGTSYSIDKTENGASFFEMSIKGNTTQNGTPTPTSLIPVNVVKGTIQVKVIGKNLFDINETEAGDIDTSTGGDVANANIRRTRYIQVQSDTTYTINFNNTANNKRLFLYNNNKQLISTSLLAPGESIKTITTTSATKYIRFKIVSTQFNAETQLEQGTTATTYEPYKSNNYPLTLGDIELCKIGTYQDYIYKDNGSWYLHKEIGKVVLDGSENWTYYSVAQGDLFRSTNAITDDTTTDNKYVPYCNYYSGLAYYYVGNRQNNNIYIANDANNLDILDNRYTKTDDFKTWLSTHNTIVYYVLATPTTTEITDDTLLSQLEALKSAKTYTGVTNISTIGNLAPIMYVKTYTIDNTSYDVVNSGNIYSKPIITIYGIGEVGVYLNNSQMFSIAFDDEATDNITIDVANMEAYTGTTQTLRNRAVTGDYSKFLLGTGHNEISFSGTIQGFVIQNYSRWL